MILLIGFYGHNEDKGRTPLWKDLKDISLATTIPWALSGDFNVVLLSEKRLGVNPPNQ